MPTNFTRKTYVDFNTPVVDADWLNGMQTKVDGIVTLLTDAGAVGDGVTNDVVNVTTVLNSSTGKVVDGSGKTYKCNSVIACTSQNIVIQNATFDFSGVPDQAGSPDKMIEFAGTQGSSTNLTSDALQGTYILPVVSTTGFAADQYAWLSSSAVFEPTQGVILGQMVRIKSVDSATQLTLFNEVLYDFNTGDTAKIAPLTPKTNITFKNVKFIGANNYSQIALYFEKCADVLIDGCSFDKSDRVAVSFSRSVNCEARGNTVRRARAVGTSYGFSIANGSYGVRVTNGYGEDLRHYVTVGDNDGVNLFVVVANNHVTACQDAGIDAHAACDFMVVDGNTLEGSAFDSGQLDGIIFQGLNWVCSNNIIVGIRRYPIFHQCIPILGIGSSVIDGNLIQNSGGDPGGDTAIYVANDPSIPGASIDRVAITSNTITGTSNQHIQVRALLGNIKNVTITGNTAINNASLFSCILRAASGYVIQNFTITGNGFKTSGVSNIYLYGEGTANISNGTIIGNLIQGGTYGVRALQATNIVEANNYNTATQKILADNGASNLILDRKQSSIVTITTATYTVLEQDEFLIANRAGTVTLTLPTASAWPGREIKVKTIQAQTVVSASSNVVPITDTAAGSTILSATDGAWALLKSDGTNWVIVQS